jgi:hypothetical protein
MITVRRHVIKSCCGNKTFVFELDIPVGKDWINTFKANGYQTSELYTKSGVLYACRAGLTVNGPFGGTKLQVKSSSANSNVLLDHLENTLKIATMPK